MRVQSGWIPELEFITDKLVTLEQLAINGKTEAVIKALYEVVPTYRPVDARVSASISREQSIHPFFSSRR
jgi:hypothetical protein